MTDTETGGVLVTGGADGIGKAIALRFLNAGMRVHVCDVRREAIAAVSGQHERLTTSIADVSRKDHVAELFGTARQALGTVQMLINNVGVGGPRAVIEDISIEEWDRTFAVNVGGTLLCMQAAIPEMKVRRSGAIINISTASTRTRLPARSAYVASKFAVEGLTLNAARELGPFGVRCNAILPGLMNNARMDGIIAARAVSERRPTVEIEQELLECVSLRCRTEVEDVAEAAFFLASPAGSRVTGELLSVSGNLEWEH